MPTLSLSRETFDGVASTPRKRKKGSPGTVQVPMKRIKRLLARAGVPKDEIRVMTAPGADPELRSLWLESLVARTRVP